MFPSELFSLKSIVSLLVLVLAVGVALLLYLTLDTDFEAQPRMSFRSTSSDALKSKIPIDEINQIINTAHQAWSIVNNK